MKELDTASQEELDKHFDFLKAMRYDPSRAPARVEAPEPGGMCVCGDPAKYKITEKPGTVTEPGHPDVWYSCEHCSSAVN